MNNRSFIFPQSVVSRSVLHICIFAGMSSALVLYPLAIRGQSTAPTATPGAQSAAPAQSETTFLEPGKPLERTLQGGEKHIYAIRAETGQFLHAIIEQLGIDVALTLYAPDGKPLGSMDSPNGIVGLEQLSTIAEAPGTYKLEVASNDKNVPAGRYRVTVEPARVLGDRDRARIGAERIFFEAAQLHLQGSADSLRNARQKFLESLPLWRTAGDRYEEALTLDRIGVIYSALGEKQRALDYFNQAVPVWRAAGDRAGEASTLGNIGVDYFDLGENKKALDYYNQALLLLRAVGDHGDEAVSLSNIGYVYRDLGEKQKALDYYTQSLALMRALGDRQGQGRTLNNMGAVYDDLGEKQKALDCYNQALLLERAAGDRVGESGTLSNIGLVYDDLGEKQKALDYYNQSLPPTRDVGDRAGEAITLTHIGAVYDDLGEKQKALDYYSQALPLAHAVGDRAAEAVTLSKIGQVYAALGEKQKALDYYGQALPLHRAVGDRTGEARTLSNIGLAYADLGEKQESLVYYTQSLPLSRAVQDPLGEASTLVRMMEYWKSLQNPGLAVLFGKQAIDRFQQVRRNIGGLGKETQQSFLKSKEDYYRELTDLLIEQGRLPEAQQVLDLLKEQEYSDYVRGPTANSLSPLALTPAEKQAEEDYQKSTALLVSLGEQWAQLKKISSRTPEQEKQYQYLSDQLDAASKALNDYYGRLYVLFGKNSEANKQLADVKGDVSLLEDQIAEMPHTVALYTMVTSDHYRVIVITATATVAREYAISDKDLSKKVSAFQQVLREPAKDPRPMAQELYKILIGPVKADLDQAQAETLVWSLDGVLRYVPIAALYDGQQYLVENYNTVTITPVSIAHLADKPDVSNMSAAAMGISRKYEDELPALPAVVGELDEIVKDAQVQAAHGVLPGTILLDGQFTEKAMENELEGQHAVVHIASHFVFKPGDDSQSYLLLAGKDAGGDGFHLTVADFRDNKKLALRHTDLLTLSACETGMSGNASNGREVDGLGTTAQLKGAKAVISSLWEVNDASTGELMADFYQRWAGSAGKMEKVEALRQAQLDLLLGKVKPGPGERGRGVDFDTPEAPASFAHPYYWAPFVLMGNWQ